MENNIGVYLETSDGRLTSLSVELLGKARQLADARPNQVLGILAGDNLEAAAQEAIAYGADGVALLQAPALASFDAALYTEAVAKALSLYTPSVLFIGALPTAVIWAAGCPPGWMQGWWLTAPMCGTKERTIP